MRFRPYVGSILLLLLTTSAVGCQYLLPQDDPDEVFLPTREIVVAARPIEQGAVIEPLMLTSRSVPIDVTNEMALTEPTEALGKVAAIDILQFQMITPNLLVDE